jgi:hypothetical protein
MNFILNAISRINVRYSARPSSFTKKTPVNAVSHLFITPRATRITHINNSLNSRNAQSPPKVFSLQFDKFIRTLDSYPPIISLGDFTVINRTLFISVSTVCHILVFVFFFRAPGATFTWQLTAHKVYSRLFLCRLSGLRIIRARLYVADD